MDYITEVEKQEVVAVRKTHWLAGGIVVWGLFSGNLGCRTAPPKNVPAQHTSNHSPQDATPSDRTPPASPGDWINDEPASMARDDQQRAAQVGDQLKPKVQAKRPEPPLRPVTR